MQFLMKKVITLICLNYGENISITIFIFIFKVQQVEAAQSRSHSLHTSYNFRIFEAEKKFQVIVWVRNDCLATRQFSFQGDADIFVIGQRIKSFIYEPDINAATLYSHPHFFSTSWWGLELKWCNWRLLKTNEEDRTEKMLSLSIIGRFLGVLKSDLFQSHFILNFCKMRPTHCCNKDPIYWAWELD